jgi:hypothetical protein
MSHMVPPLSGGDAGGGKVPPPSPLPDPPLSGGGARYRRGRGSSLAPQVLAAMWVMLSPLGEGTQYSSMTKLGQENGRQQGQRLVRPPTGDRSCPSSCLGQAGATPDKPLGPKERDQDEKGTRSMTQMQSTLRDDLILQVALQDVA